MKQKKRYRKLQQEASGEMQEVPGEGMCIQLPVGMEEMIQGTSALVERVAQEVGLQIMEMTLVSEAQQKAGKKHRKEPGRDIHWWGSQPGWVYYEGQKVPLQRPRIRHSQDGEIPLKSYQAFQSPTGMRETVMRDMVLGISSRNYEEMITKVHQGYGIKKSSVSRHFVKASAQQLQEFLERPLGGQEFCVLFIDGIVFAGECLVCALGIDREGNKQVLGLWQGATENATVCRHLLEDLLRRGLERERNYLWVVDGSKALRSAVEGVFGEEVLVQRCQQHKRRNVRAHLPKGHQAQVDARLCAAYQMRDYEEAKQALDSTVEFLERLNPSAARSLQEGMEETLTLHRLGLAESLRRTLSTTNPIESCFSVTRSLLGRIKRFRQGNMTQRWAVMTLLRAEKKFRKIRGFRVLPQFLNALENNSLYKKEVAA